VAADQLNLFGAPPARTLPEGLVYRDGVLTSDDEQTLLARLPTLPFAPFEFQGFLGNRRTVSFGWHYAFDGSGLRETEPIPDWLRPARDRAAAFAGLEADALVHLLVIEYAPGAGIGWHRDRPVFGDVVGLSLGAPARLRFRRRIATDGSGSATAKWERVNLIAQPRSAYLLRGAARDEWEHSLPELEALRYSLTFRTLRAQSGA